MLKLRVRCLSSHLFVSLAVWVLCMSAQIACGTITRFMEVDTASQPKISVGHPAPTFELSDLEGNQISLLTQQGSPVVINFWASWCGPCKAEMKDLEAVYEDYHNQGLVLLSVNFKEPAEQVIGYASQQKLTFPVLLDDHGNVSDLYLVKAIPATYFIDDEGIIQRIHIGSLTRENFEKIVLDLLIKGQ
jgi:peroxiredoxin